MIEIQADAYYRALKRIVDKRLQKMRKRWKRENISGIRKFCFS